YGIIDKKGKSGAIARGTVAALQTANNGGNAGAIATNALAPVVSYEIGQYYKGENAEGSLGHIAAHAALGAVTATANGGNALAGAVSAGAAEYLAPKISETLYGTSNSQELSEKQRDTVIGISSFAGALTSGTIGDNANNAAIGLNTAKTAVENNWLKRNQNIHKNELEKLKAEKIKRQKELNAKKQLTQEEQAELKKVNSDLLAINDELNALNAESKKNDREMDKAMNYCIDYFSCNALRKNHWDIRYENTEEGYTEWEKDRKNGTLEQNWVKLPDEQAIYHNIGKTGSTNIKFVDKATGQYEVVLDTTTGKTIYDMKKVTDHINGGTFNFYAPAPLDWTNADYNKANLLHRKYDVLPWTLVGNGYFDTTTYQTRTSKDNFGWGGSIIGKHFTISDEKINKINYEIRKIPVDNKANINDLFQQWYYFQ
ncbi:MAG: VENN motif pre-toxin domain-containing protein, partial [Neisseriaceae bacterium]|nr:VENN motif pre-toxin domain-containing protein [Neisseriaceae bacterium]